MFSYVLWPVWGFLFSSVDFSVSTSVSVFTFRVYPHCSPSLTSSWLFSLGLFFRWNLESLYKVFTPKSHWYLCETTNTHSAWGRWHLPVCHLLSESVAHLPHILTSLPSWRSGTFLLKIIVRYLGFFYCYLEDPHLIGCGVPYAPSSPSLLIAYVWIFSFGGFRLLACLIYTFLKGVCQNLPL